MANKLYRIDACGHFDIGGICGLFIIAPDSASARYMVKARIPSLRGKAVFVEEVHLEEHTDLIFGVEHAHFGCVKMPSVDEVGVFEVEADYI